MMIIGGKPNELGGHSVSIRQIAEWYEPEGSSLKILRLTAWTMYTRGTR
jgi:hypothetical protein